MILSVLKSKMRPGTTYYENSGTPAAVAPELRTKLIQRVVNWAEKNGQTDIKADRQGLEMPKSVLSDLSSSPVKPDVSADVNGVGILYAVESYLTLNDEIAVQRLSDLAKHARKHARLFVIAVPRDCGDLARRLTEERRLDAQVLEIDL